MKNYLLIALISLMFLGCAKKNDTTPTPAVDVTGNWELVVFTISPAPVNGTNDYLAYLRQIFGYNCSEIDFFYNFKSDHTFTETTQSTCQSSGNTSDDLLDGTWTMTQTSLSITADDGSGTKQTQTYQMDLSPGTTGKYTQLKLTATISGSTYLLMLNKQ